MRSSIEWVYVKDRLPENGYSRVIVAYYGVEGNRIRSGWYQDKRFFDEDLEHRIHYVYAWAVVPSPPSSGPARSVL